MTPKFGIGEVVFFMYENRVHVEMITGVMVHILSKAKDGNINEFEFLYTTYQGSICVDFQIKEKDLFRSKEQLLKSL